MTYERPAPDGVGLSHFRISSTAARTLDRWAWGIADGSIRLWQLPDAVNTLYRIGIEHGRSSRDEEVRLLRLDADRLWLCSFGDKERLDYLLARLDRAAELADRPDVDDVLDEAWRIYLASLDNIRQPITLPTSSKTMREVA
ncbi:hypothetical protein RS86_00459 [Microbacterium azadirachtae]|uniref:Uncharacterized protein n=1 Tax=Microbacterium azadirachtae TaxID=582680 RepID=A0A0F0LQN4_9MICO|nr:hypothetical protein RS86_00459 [Microbacterium azadirachtae]